MEEANEIITGYMKIRPPNPHTIYTYGLYLYSIDELDECLKHLKTVFTLDPNYEKAASTYRQVKKLKQLRETGSY